MGWGVILRHLSRDDFSHRCNWEARSFAIFGFCFDSTTYHIKSSLHVFFLSICWIWSLDKKDLSAEINSLYS